LNQPTLTATLSLAGTSVAAAGVHQLQAVYPGDANYMASSSSSVATTFLQSTTTLSASSSSAPTGTHGGTAYPAVTLVNGVATYTTTSLTPGAHTVQAIYSGSASDAASTSAALNQTVNAPAAEIRDRDQGLIAGAGQTPHP
jgi:large repetitive protein